MTNEANTPGSEGAGREAVGRIAALVGEADPDGVRVTEILDGIPGAWERAQVSIKQARRGETVPLSELQTFDTRG